MEMVKITSPDFSADQDKIHIWRSKFFDKTSKCERELRRLLALPSNDKSHFKVMAEKVIAANMGEKKTSLTKLVEELIPLIELRAELAHSHFVGLNEGETSDAMFDNACFTHKHFKRLAVLSHDQRKNAFDRLSWIAGQLATIAA